MYTVKVRGDYVNGKFLRPRGPERRIVSKDPGDSGYRIGSFPVYPQHVDKAVEAARRAFGQWSRLGQTHRADMLRKFAAEVVNNRGELIKLIAAETGKPVWEAESEARDVEAQVETEIREGVRSVSPFKVGEIRWGVEGSCRFKPLGIAVVLGPAISPVHLACSQIIPALLSGCTVVFKPSKLAPATGQFVTGLLDEIELPRGVFNMVQGDAATGSLLAAHEDVDAVLFTGSYPAGKHILQATAEQPHKMVALQMGGVNVALVLEDADFEQALYETVTGAFLTAGQRYTTTGVILVENALYSRFAEAFADVVRSLKVGYSQDPDVFMGPVLSESAQVRFLDLQQRMSATDARPLLEGRPLKLERPGFYLSPAVHAAEKAGDIDEFRPEGLSFGPDVVLVPVENAEKGCELANSTNFPFAAAVFSQDPQRFEECAGRLRFGIVNCNTATTSTSMRLPRGGARKCSNHRPAGVFSQRNCTFPVASLRAHTPFEPDRVLPCYPRKPREDW
jgi:succinylglutamic semialdehyde dehydrogenase